MLVYSLQARALLWKGAEVTLQAWVLRLVFDVLLMEGFVPLATTATSMGALARLSPLHSYQTRTLIPQATTRDQGQLVTEGSLYPEGLAPDAVANKQNQGNVPRQKRRWRAA